MVHYPRLPLRGKLRAVHLVAIAEVLESHSSKTSN
jgi:hypothetical protein